MSGGFGTARSGDGGIRLYCVRLIVVFVVLMEFFPVFKAMIGHVPGGPAGRPVRLAVPGPYRHLGLARKCLVQTGQNLKNVFKTVRFRARSKPGWPDY
jgi:hypothetical protein